MSIQPLDACEALAMLRELRQQACKCDVPAAPVPLPATDPQQQPVSIPPPPTPANCQVVCPAAGWRPIAMRGQTGARITGPISYPGATPMQVVNADPTRRLLWLFSTNSGLWALPAADIITSPFGGLGMPLGSSNYSDPITEDTHGILVQYPWFVFSAGASFISVIEEYYLFAPAPSQPIGGTHGP